MNGKVYGDVFLKPMYQTWSWYAAAERHFAPPGSLRVLLIRKGNRLLGAAPLCIVTQSRYGLIHRRILTFLSSYSYAHPLDQSPLIEVDAVESVLPLLTEKILELGGFDVVSFELFESGSAAHVLLEELGRLKERRVNYRFQATSHFLNLPSTYKKYISAPSEAWCFLPGASPGRVKDQDDLS